ncbi:MAG TPA: flagellar FlbD family protein [Microthrixaceae bacterium]|nr:flagellar FlbD family protein [Microthrixaceae bacterium]
MILLTRLNGTRFGINADLIERVETTGDTVVWLIDGTRFIVSESPAAVVDAIIDFRGRVLASAEMAVTAAEFESDDVGRNGPGERGALRLVVERTGTTDNHSEGH